MTWGGFSANGTTSLATTSHRMKSEDYQQVLSDHLLPNAGGIAGRNWTFQHDNAPIHASRSTKDWLNSNSIRTMTWPSHSPDLNPMENVWGHLARQVYGHGKQYESVQELKTSLQSEWGKLPPSYLSRLTNSMPDRLFSCVAAKGGYTKY